MTVVAPPLAVIIQQGKILDFIDGITQRNETPEEYVRQEIAKSLVREYDYLKAEIAVELLISQQYTIHIKRRSGHALHGNMI